MSDFGPMSHRIMTIPLRDGVAVNIFGLPHDLTAAEAAKVAAVIRALAEPDGADGADGVTAKLAQALTAAKAEIASLRQDQANASRKLEIDAFEAETNRLKAMQK